MKKKNATKEYKKGVCVCVCVNNLEELGGQDRQRQEDQSHFAADLVRTAGHGLLACFLTWLADILNVHGGVSLLGDRDRNRGARCSRRGHSSRSCGSS